MIEQGVNEFYREYNLVAARKDFAKRTPAAHQNAALEKLQTWFSSQANGPAGGMLVLPTGGGKTFTAMRFLCAGPLSQGYKVLWLAHTHHLLEQALVSMEGEVGQIVEPKQKLRARVVSGTPGHCRVNEIKPSDDMVIGTLQTMTQAEKTQHPALEAFLRAAGKKLFVVFDEAHHSPAHSYRTLIKRLNQSVPDMFLLGLTATPTYTDEKKRGWLKQLFPQGILYQVSPQQLMAARILAKPIFDDHRTEFTTDFDERGYQKWRGTYRDLPEDIITQLADSRERNLFIAQTYVEQRERYGKTIIFADRWFQCEQLRELLRKRGVRADAVYAHVDADPGSPEARNRRIADENKQVLEAFRSGGLDVLINVRMLTEGTDVPDVQTVFLTRQTTSSILLTQMIGRALRGPQFGGTDKAYIVSFIDDWKHLINWADYRQFGRGELDPGMPAYARRPPLQLISIDLVRRLAQQMDSGLNIATQPFLTLMPIGWYLTEFAALAAGSDDQEITQQLVMVFDNEEESYQRFITALLGIDLEIFADESVDLDKQHDQLEGWRQQFFADIEERVGGDLLTNLFHIARHIAQNEAAPPWFLFEERQHHDLDVIAQHLLERRLSRWEEDESLQVEYRRADRYWAIIYPNFGLFKSQYNACVERILQGSAPSTSPSFVTPESPNDREPSSEIKDQVKARDGFRCLSCGEDNRRLLEVDHVAPSYFGGSNVPDNLQTLCRVCNRHKGISKINFRSNRTLLTEAPSEFPTLELPSEVGKPEAWEKFLQRSINFFYRCTAVDFVRIGRRRNGQYYSHWLVYLYAGNDPRWLSPHLAEVLRDIQAAREKEGYEGPDDITVGAPDVPEVLISARRARRDKSSNR